jgi:hypothetical protein
MVTLMADCTFFIENEPLIRKLFPKDVSAYKFAKCHPSGSQGIFIV